MKAHHVPAILHTVANARFGPVSNISQKLNIYATMCLCLIEVCIFPV